MICHSNSLSSNSFRSRDVDPGDPRVALIVGSLETLANVVEWQDDRVVLSIDDPADSFRQGLFVAQVMSLVHRNQRFGGTVQAMHTSSTGKLRLQVSWNSSVWRQTVASEEIPTLCAC
jgi:hypothetical protein